MIKSDYIFIYVACRDITEARKIAGHCVTEKLAASANIFPQMESFYWWDGVVNSETESVLILKTMSKRFKDIEQAVQNLHSYECPCIVSLPIMEGTQPFLQWLSEHTKR